MIRTTRALWAALGALVLAICLGAPAHAGQKDLRVSVYLPPANELGKYAGADGFIIGTVKDETFAENPAHVGMGPQAVYEIVTPGTREDAVRDGLAEAFSRAGLLASAATAVPHRVDITIRRYNSSTHLTFARFRLRSEIFLEFSFSQNGVAEGRVLASGNAQTYAQVANTLKYAEVYQAAFNDAIFKLFNSKTMARIAGADWKPAPARETSGKSKAVRISKDEFYGPTDSIQAEVARALDAIPAGKFREIALPDFKLEEVSGGSNSPVADLAFARALVPELVREHLDAFYPGAFAQIVRNQDRLEPSVLVVEGKLEDFRVGNFYLRRIVGFGAGKDKLKGTIQFKDAVSGEELFAFDVLSSNWGAAWQTKRGNIRDMADQLARDIAFFLVKTSIPDYRPPDDMEVMFDETPYPVPQRKS